jgi:hypothetical protein
LLRLQPVLTLVIAVVAIGLAIWEGMESRRQNRLTVQPRIAAEINTGRESGRAYIRMSVESTGLGPAVINTFRVFFDGALQDATGAPDASVWRNVLAAFDPSETQINARTLGTGYYFPAGREETLFEARRVQSDSDATSLAGSLARLGLQICYCSVYGTDCDEVLLTTRDLNPSDCERPMDR